MNEDAGAVTHRCPPEGSGIMPCCGRTPFEVLDDRITLDDSLVTCRRPGWWVVSDYGLMSMLRAVEHGDSPDAVYAEHYANSEHRYEEDR
jgi:hypothetical protein